MSKDHIKIKLEGGKELAKDLERMGKDAGAAIALNEMEGVWKDVENRIRYKAPVETGALKDSITLTSKRDHKGLRTTVTIGKGGKSGTTRSGKRKPVYAIQVEFGTDGTKEHNFIRPAFDGREDIYVKRLMKRLSATVLMWKNITNYKKG